jgi:deoxyribodipyrimidine photo-lyase
MNGTLETFATETLSGRVRMANAGPLRRNARYVLYWMITARRPHYNFGLERAIGWARLLNQPLIVLEALRVDYPWASDRLHRFVIDGMSANADRFRSTPITYFPYVEPERDAGRGLLERLGQEASLVVTDEFPCFFIPRMVARAASLLDVRLEVVDSNGLLPIHLADRPFTAAVHFRRFMQKHLREALLTWPQADPLRGARLPRIDLPADVRRKWKAASPSLLKGDPRALRRLPIDHDVPAVELRGGARVGRRALQGFVRQRLARYHHAHNHPDDRGTSRLSPYLHFGHLSAHEIFDAVMKHERWSARQLSTRPNGRREGWWNVGPGAEAFLDQFVVWRELGFNTCTKRPEDFNLFEGLPAWALATLHDHEEDERPYVYTKEQFERGETHDPLWNAAQREMRQTGWFHNYMRMLWGKKILEWSRTPREALKTMEGIMNRWSLDGRDPNAYSGYFWTLGRYDRPWPERPIYGKVRSMSSASTVKKVRVREYLKGIRD